MTKEQIAAARRLADDMEQEPSHPAMNRAGDLINTLLDEREALLEALIEMVHDNRPGGGAVDRALRAIAKAEAE